MRRFWLICLMTISLTSVAGGIDPYAFESKEQEAVYKEIIEELRCLVCQNQNIAGSNAELAQDLRRQAYEMILEGKSKEAIYTYMVDRYGDFVLYQPPVKRSTLVLWVGPFVILLVGVGVMILVIRRRTQTSGGNLTQADLDRVEKMLDRDDKKS